MTSSFFNFCASMRMPELFHYEQITAFFEYYLMDSTHAHSSLANLMSAWRDFAEEHQMHFPGKKSRELRRINKYIRGAQLRYPHEPARCRPITIDLLSLIANSLHIYTVDNYFTCSLSVLVFMTRVLTAHTACMRVCEHADGCRVDDVSHPDPQPHSSSYLLLHVGRRIDSRKIKRRPARTCVLPVRQHRLSAGRALQILMARIHSGCSSRNDVLFPRFFGERRSPNPTPWPRILGQLRHILKAAPPPSHVDPSTIEGRSLRAGGATDWFAAGATAGWVSAQGGWLSNVYMTYNRPTPASRYAQAPQLMASVLPSRAEPAVRHPSARTQTNNQNYAFSGALRRNAHKSRRGPLRFHTPR